MDSNEIVFFACGHNANGTTDLSIVSPHRNIEATLIHQTWQLKRSNGIERSYTASNTPLETVTFAQLKADVKLSPEELIVLSGENATELMIEIGRDELPCLLATSSAIETHKYRVAGNLAIVTWAETADFQAEQSYWTTRYQKQIDAGDDFLKPRLEDYANERRLAETILIKSGDRLPVNFDHEGKHCVGCLVFEAIDGRRFEGYLFINKELDSLPRQIERHVSSDGGAFMRQIVATEFQLLDD
jgi:hypothetical protein